MVTMRMSAVDKIEWTESEGAEIRRLAEGGLLPNEIVLILITDRALKYKRALEDIESLPARDERMGRPSLADAVKIATEVLS